MVFDVLRRWMMACGYDVTVCRNVTDIDDKIRSRQRGAATVVGGRPALRAGIQPRLRGPWLPAANSGTPRHRPHSADDRLIGRPLLESGAAYAVGGDVYYRLPPTRTTGNCPGQRPDDLQAAADPPATCSNAIPATSHCGRPPSRGAGGESPWGPGRPGWHLECSAMAVYYLGSSSTSTVADRPDLPAPRERTGPIEGRGDPFARYRMHNSWVTAAGEKMGKSLGNALAVDEVLKHVRPVELRYYYLAAAHPVDAGVLLFNPSPSRLSISPHPAFLQRLAGEPLPAALASNAQTPSWRHGR